MESQTSKKKHRKENVFLRFCILNMILSFHFARQILHRFAFFLRLFYYCHSQISAAIFHPWTSDTNSCLESQYEYLVSVAASSFWGLYSTK